MRDSQSLFDQLLAFGSEHITSADVHRLLGTAPDDRLTGLIDALIDRRRDEALQRLDYAMREGVQLEAFTDQLVAYFRDLMVIACGANEVPLLAVGDDCRQILGEQAARWGLQTIATGMQILAEAKVRMQRVSYGRALAELALVRISLLENLDRLDDLIAQLKGGGMSNPASSNLRSLPERSVPENQNATARYAPPVIAPPAAIPLPAQPPKTAPQIPRSPAEKKNESAEQKPPAVMPTELAAPVSSAEGKKPVIEWKPGNENDLQSILADRLNDMVGTSVRRAKSLAIIGPNVLEIAIPMNYDVERRTLDRPETVSRLEAIVGELTGESIRIRFRTAEAVESAAKPVAAPTPSTRVQIVDNPEDSFLQEVTEVFGVKSWKVKELIVEASEADSVGSDS